MILRSVFPKKLAFFLANFFISIRELLEKNLGVLREEKTNSFLRVTGVRGYLRPAAEFF